jgi:transmembrane sensor
MSVFGRGRRAIDGRAADWVVRLEGAPLTEAELQALAAWRARDPAHEAAFTQARAVWAECGRLTSAAVVPLRPRRAAVPYRLAALAAVVLIAISLGISWFGDPRLLLEADYRTGPGGGRSVTLADGSLVQLDASSALAIRFDARERRVALLAGEAYFTVSPMTGPERRPFVVEAADGTAKALGTEFMVARQGTGAEVTVAVHRVAVAVAGDAGPASVVLAPGQAVRYGRAGVGAVTTVDLTRETAWRRGRLIFDDVRLKEVVAALERYRHGRIVLADAGLGETRVSGVFETDDPDGALAAIAEELHLGLFSVPGVLTVLH